MLRAILMPAIPMSVLMPVLMPVLMMASASALGQSAEAAEDGKAPAGGVAIFGERLMHYSLYPDDGGGSARFNPPIPFDDRDMLLTAMKSATRALFGEHRLVVEDETTFTPRIGAVTKLQDLDYDYLFMLDGSVERGVSTLLIQRKEVDRPPDEGSLPPQF
jgi:hypothetical protein